MTPCSIPGPITAEVKSLPVERPSASEDGLCSIYEGRTESHEQLFFLHANWEEQTKESAVVMEPAVVLSLSVLCRQ